ncbi:MAG: hypothetical protein JRH11_04255 [Deltaproteobacteria bacterium]|nr:hypothetical protein [Deltaproteobacteria bacterium]
MMKALLLKSLLRALALVLATSSLAAPARAQQGPASTDDVEWESRREAWNGEPVRPGGELEGETNGWLWAGTSALIGGYALSFLGLDPRPGSVIPLVGPWLSATGVFDEEPWSDGQTVAMIFSGVLQLGGVLGIILGALNPRYYVIYDAPVGAPPLYVTWAPGIDGAEVGASVRVDLF